MKEISVTRTINPIAANGAFSFLNSIAERNTDIRFDASIMYANNIDTLTALIDTLAEAPQPEAVSLVRLEEKSGDYHQAYFPKYFSQIIERTGPNGIYLPQKEIHDFAYAHTDRDDLLLRKEGFLAFMKQKDGTPLAVFVIGQGDDIQFQIAPVSEYGGSVSDYWNFILPI